MYIEVSESTFARLQANATPLVDNVDAQAFWTNIGWKERSEIRLMSHTASGSANA